jgi:hypothetical protein
MILGQGDVKDVLEAAIRRLNADAGEPLCGGRGETVETAFGFMALEKDKSIRLLEAYRDRKDGGWNGSGNSWKEEIVLVGFSDGATQIWDMFNRGIIQAALAARKGPHAGQPYKVAFVGFIDLVRQHIGLTDWVGEDFNQPDRQLRLEDGGVILAGRNYFQQDPGGWKGTARFYQGEEPPGAAHPRIASVLVADASHGGSLLPNREAILRTAAIRESLPKELVAAYKIALNSAAQPRPIEG